MISDSVRTISNIISTMESAYPTVVRRRKVKMYVCEIKLLLQRLCRIEKFRIITAVGLGSLHCTDIQIVLPRVWNRFESHFQFLY